MVVGDPGMAGGDTLYHTTKRHVFVCIALLGCFLVLGLLFTVDAGLPTRRLGDAEKLRSERVLRRLSIHIFVS